MQIIKRYFMTLLCFVAAIVSYRYEIPAAGVLLLVTGLVFELFFWLGLLGEKSKVSSKVRLHGGFPKYEGEGHGQKKHSSKRAKRKAHGKHHGRG